MLATLQRLSSLRLLGLDEDAEPPIAHEGRVAYRKMALRGHPDGARSKDNAWVATRSFQYTENADENLLGEAERGVYE